MKLKAIILSICTFLTLSLGAAESGQHLFILSGQSNMARMNDEKWFTPIVEKKLGKENVIVVKEAQGGAPISRWYPQGNMYSKMMAKVEQAIEGKDIKSVTFVWMQGERDAKDKRGRHYAKDLEGLIKKVGAEFKQHKVNVVIGRLKHYEGEDFPDWEAIRKVQVQVAKAKKNRAWVDTDDFDGDENDVHFRAEGYRELGAAFAKSALKLVRIANE